jgi:hypothetical protein
MQNRQVTDWSAQALSLQRERLGPLPLVNHFLKRRFWNGSVLISATIWLIAVFNSARLKNCRSRSAPRTRRSATSTPFSTAALSQVSNCMLS